MEKSMLFGVVIFACLLSLCKCTPTSVVNDEQQLQLASILPKLQAIQEDCQALLKKNTELRAVILAGLHTSTEAAKLKPTSTIEPINAQTSSKLPVGGNIRLPTQSTKQIEDKNSNRIDYAELEEFNRWVGVNLDYAVKNTLATIETLKEEAQQNNGKIDYSLQAINDGIEGVKYWQSAVIFQDKTLKNEKFDDVQ